MTRLAIIDKSKCINGAGCNEICLKYCPVNRTGADCITINPINNKPIIDEELCTGCGICPKRCPVECIDIVNLPERLKEDPIHRYGKNAFELFRLPIPKKNTIVGILGRNGIGKSTALNILSGTLKPNLGNYEELATDTEITERYSKSYLGEYFNNLFNENIKISYKPQRIELLPKLYKGTVIDLVKKVDEKNIGKQLLKDLGMQQLEKREINKLSGGELQKLAIIAAATKQADVYYFDEPASFLDITTRIKVAKLIRSLVSEETSVVVIEHDLATLDYISDEIQIVYGKAAAFGVLSNSKSVRRGINEYMDGYLTDDNVRFRDYPIKFSGTAVERATNIATLAEFPELEKSFETFSVKVNKGDIKKGEVLAIMGANGLGKSTFLKMLSGQIKPDKGDIKELKIAFKDQYPDPSIGGTVGEWLKATAKDKFTSGWYRSNILEKLGLNKLLESDVSTLSGGELQKFHVALTLSKTADIYAFDEPSAFVDVEDRLVVAEVIRDFMTKGEVCAIVVDHDVQFIDYIGDSLLVFEGIPGKEGSVYGPVSKREGMNRVLKFLDITYRFDKESNRPRINKPDSQLDKQQRASGNYYYA